MNETNTLKTDNPGLTKDIEAPPGDRKRVQTVALGGYQARDEEATVLVPLGLSVAFVLVAAGCSF